MDALHSTDQSARALLETLGLLGACVYVAHLATVGKHVTVLLHLVLGHSIESL